MNTNFSFTQKASNFGFNPPQDHDRTTRKKAANDQWSETHFLRVGRDGNELKTGHFKQENGGENEPEKENETVSFWTVCPYCYHMYEYESKYEECCLLCQHCGRGFHGLAVEAPPESFLANGNVRGYHLGYGLFPLGYSGDNGFLSNKKQGGEKQVVVEISDDSEGEKEGVGMENKGCECEVKTGGTGKGWMRRVKAVARNPKKLMGRGIKQKGMVEKMHVMEMNEEFWKEVDKKEDDGLEFFEGDDDIFVGLRDIC
ncbi:hypothetical protein HRI_003081600 [Hibiscus trionum]|uniref:Uncharacterized protein n=1 Tax=Hibiscus trionum TaxID=183268 RepID=A0A9W7IEW1_HIBTR|nr:hypothetical protein HRI_003081600 [Hibiscus trionum]